MKIDIETHEKTYRCDLVGESDNSKKWTNKNFGAAIKELDKLFKGIFF